MHLYNFLKKFSKILRHWWGGPNSAPGPLRGRPLKVSVPQHKNSGDFLGLPRQGIPLVLAELVYRFIGNTPLRTSNLEKFSKDVIIPVLLDTY